MTVNKVEKFFVCFVIWLFFWHGENGIFKEFSLEICWFSCSLLCFSFFRLLCCQFQIELSRLFHTSVIERTQYESIRIYARWCSTLDDVVGCMVIFWQIYFIITCLGNFLVFCCVYLACQPKIRFCLTYSPTYHTIPHVRSSFGDYENRICWWFFGTVPIYFY